MVKGRESGAGLQQPQPVPPRPPRPSSWHMSREPLPGAVKVPISSHIH